uniref:Uncharacterized protein n=1 Tax=Anopheles coluzzii TaxID=1518534 RepID=A0A8W7NZD2_ANOCL
MQIKPAATLLAADSCCISACRLRGSTRRPPLTTGGGAGLLAGCDGAAVACTDGELPYSGEAFGVGSGDLMPSLVSLARSSSSSLASPNRRLSRGSFVPTGRTIERLSAP